MEASVILEAEVIELEDLLAGDIDLKGFLKGEKGEPGYTPVKGVDYVDGKDFTYDMFTPEQLAALVGPQGETGPIGPQGIQGIQGIQGETGFSGVFVGQEEPTDTNVTVWVDTNSDADDLKVIVQAALEEVENGSY